MIFISVVRLECLEVAEERDVCLGGGVTGGGRDIHSVFGVLWGWGGLGLRSWAILTEPRSAAVPFLHAEVAVIARRDAVLTLGNAVDARVRAAALSADCLVDTAAGRVAVALAVVTLPGMRLRRGRGRCLRRRGGGPGALARLGLSLASVL